MTQYMTLFVLIFWHTIRCRIWTKFTPFYSRKASTDHGTWERRQTKGNDFLLFVAKWIGKTKQWFALIANVVGMTQIIALHSLDTLSGGVIGRALTERMEAMVGDHNLRYNMGKTKQWFAPIANVVGMTQIFALHSLDTPSGGVIDGTLTERMEVVVGDRNPRYSMGKTKQWFAPIANVVGMTQILALHSLDISSGGVIDRALTERMKVVVGDRNPRYNMGKTKQWFAPITNVVGMTQILALHSLDTPSGGVIDRTLVKRMEVVVGDHNPRCSKQKSGRPRLWYCAGQCSPGHTWKFNHRKYIGWEWRGISWSWYCVGQYSPDHTWKVNHRKYIGWEWRGISWAEPWLTPSADEIAKGSK